MTKKLSEYRYELKYAIDPIAFSSFLHVLHLHPAGFKTTYPDRRVNNVYFDNLHFQSCQENLSGISNRTKIRYRWYGDFENFTDGKLEFKIKNNALGCKEYLELENPNSVPELAKEVNEKLKRSDLFPSLINSYNRSYYIDNSNKFRLTVDNEVSYWLPNNFRNIDTPIFIDEKQIIEIKFDQENHKLFNAIASHFPFRLTKHSKYVNGILNLVY
ncbi:MAG: VTC domain-containing protein [Saprospiraceae bacterium]|nr:VTC domain-containing protein [Saprospiraceae bacterium]